MEKIILASGSPYRKQLLEQLSLAFSVVPSNVDEELIKKMDLTPEKICLELAKAKATEVFNKYSDHIVIGSDQLLTMDSEIFDKPGTAETAIKQLSKLQGKNHRLITAVSIVSNNKEISFSNITTLTMKELSQKQIEHYVQKDNPLDCAGSYKIEKLGISLFSKIDSSDSTSIIGLPLIQLCCGLENFGIEIL
jgi:septum formation protein